MPVVDETNLSQPLEDQQEAAIGASEKEVLVTPGGHASVLKTGTCIGISKHLVHERLDFGRALLGQPLVIVVGPQFVDLAPGLLRREVVNGACVVKRRTGVDGDLPCHAEIHDFHVVIAIHHDVLGLDVPVHDASAVRGRKLGGDLATEVNHSS